jgi:hypothetical protein
MRTADFDYVLPPERIATRPAFANRIAITPTAPRGCISPSDGGGTPAPAPS